MRRGTPAMRRMLKFCGSVPHLVQSPSHWCMYLVYVCVCLCVCGISFPFGFHIDFAVSLSRPREYCLCAARVHVGFVFVRVCSRGLHDRVQRSRPQRLFNPRAYRRCAIWCLCRCRVVFASHLRGLRVLCRKRANTMSASGIYRKTIDP